MVKITIEFDDKVIRKLKKRVDKVIRIRGTLRNYLGRVYQIKTKFINKGSNYLIQGSAADIFKDRMLAAIKEIDYAYIMLNIHDALYFSVPIPRIEEFYTQCKEILEDFELRVPLKVDAKISGATMANTVEFKCVEDIREALEVSKTAGLRKFGGGAASSIIRQRTDAEKAKKDK